MAGKDDIMPQKPVVRRSARLAAWISSWWKPQPTVRQRAPFANAAGWHPAQILCLEERALLAGPTVTTNTASIGANATTLVIKGTGFSTTLSQNSVVVKDTVSNKSITVTPTVSTTTTMTVTISTMGTMTGGDQLTAVVTTSGVSSGAAVQVATIAPIVTLSTKAVTSTTLTISGVGFSTIAASNSVLLKDSVTGNTATVTPTAATATSLTVSLSTLGTLTGGDKLTAVVTTGGVSSGNAVQVGLVTPLVTPNSTITTSTTITIDGFAFDSTIAHNKVTLNNSGRSIAGTILTASNTSLTVSFSGPVTAGPLNATVTVNNISSGKPVQVASIQPLILETTTQLAPGARQVIIYGFGFDPNHAQNTVVFSSGAVGVVTSCSANALIVTFLVKPKTAGPLTAIVTTRHVSSGAAVQVATV
ncbi:MAG: hypothetical protein JSS02_04980 [Planctomycetes bacterium]|nr:hypothetical protein [Planctomycetota bacterium]